MSHTAADLLSMSGKDLDDVFRESPPGRIPEGTSRGTAIVIAGSGLDKLIRGFVRVVAWQGKVFRNGDRPDRSTLKNRMTPFGFQIFEAQVYEDDSWFADGNAIILDYSKSSFLVRRIRDEIRQVDPGLYLGQVFWGKKRLIHFMLEFPGAGNGSGAASDAPGAATDAPPAAAAPPAADAPPATAAPPPADAVPATPSHGAAAPGEPAAPEAPRAPTPPPTSGESGESVVPEPRDPPGA